MNTGIEYLTRQCVIRASSTSCTIILQGRATYLPFNFKCASKRRSRRPYNSRERVLSMGIHWIVQRPANGKGWMGCQSYCRATSYLIRFDSFYGLLRSVAPFPSAIKRFKHFKHQWRKDNFRKESEFVRLCWLCCWLCCWFCSFCWLCSFCSFCSFCSSLPPLPSPPIPFPPSPPK